MCLIAFAWGAHPRFPFVIAANRDEFFERPTAPLSLWKSSNGTEILAGRDLQGGGTWIGFSPNGRFAMLTNVRNPAAILPADPLSRGGLVVDWLESELKVDAWAQRLQAQRYPGFNLIIGDWLAKQCHYLSNQTLPTQNLMPFSLMAGTESAQNAMYLVAHELAWGAVYGLSNAALDTPWPKTVRLKNALSEGLTYADAEQLVAVSLEALNHRSSPPDNQLPQTGVPIALERALSTAFVSHPAQDPNYGTRTSLVTVCELGQGLRVTELTHPLDNAPALTTQMQINWPV
jgi:uncharacterized protein with NRDE domain